GRDEARARPRSGRDQRDRRRVFSRRGRGPAGPGARVGGASGGGTATLYACLRGATGVLSSASPSRLRERGVEGASPIGMSVGSTSGNSSRVSGRGGLNSGKSAWRYCFRV